MNQWNSKGKKSGVQWKVYVIDDPKTASVYSDQTILHSLKNHPDAFVLPNGSIFVFSGILPITANEDGLAAVLGHEVAHSVARHSAERMSFQKVLTEDNLQATTDCIYR